MSIQILTLLQSYKLDQTIVEQSILFGIYSHVCSTSGIFVVLFPDPPIVTPLSRGGCTGGLGLRMRHVAIAKYYSCQ